MDFQIHKVGAVTEKGNVCLTVYREVLVEADGVQVPGMSWYFIVVKAEGLSKVKGDDLTLNMDEIFTTEVRQFTPEEGENAGVTRDMVWIIPRM